MKFNEFLVFAILIVVVGSVLGQPIGKLKESKEAKFDLNNPEAWTNDDILNNYDAIYGANKNELLRRMGSDAGLRSQILGDRDRRDRLFLEDNNLLNQEGYRDAARNMFNEQFSGCTFSSIEGEITGYSNPPPKIETAEGSLSLEGMSGNYDVRIDGQGIIYLNGKGMTGEISNHEGQLSIENGFYVTESKDSIPMSGDFSITQEGVIQGTFTEFHGIESKDGMKLTYSNGVVNIESGIVSNIDSNIHEKKVRIGGSFSVEKGNKLGSFKSEGVDITIIDKGSLTNKKYKIPNDIDVNFESGTDVNIPRISVNENDNFFTFNDNGFVANVIGDKIFEYDKYGLDTKTTGVDGKERSYLMIGDSGDNVKSMQYAINEERAKYNLPPIQVDGEYGPETSAAIKDLQEKLGLSSDGKFGERTNKALIDVYRVYDSNNKGEKNGGIGKFMIIETPSTMEYDEEGHYKSGEAGKYEVAFNGDFEYGRYINLNSENSESDTGYQKILYSTMDKDGNYHIYNNVGDSEILGNIKFLRNGELTDEYDVKIDDDNGIQTLEIEIGDKINGGLNVESIPKVVTIVNGQIAYNDFGGYFKIGDELPDIKDRLKDKIHDGKSAKDIIEGITPDLNFVDNKLLTSVVATESRGVSGVEGDEGSSRGYGGIKAGAETDVNNYFGTTLNREKPADNIKIAGMYLEMNIERFHSTGEFTREDSIRIGTMAYNNGPTVVNNIIDSMKKSGTTVNADTISEQLKATGKNYKYEMFISSRTHQFYADNSYNQDTENLVVAEYDDSDSFSII